MLHHSMLAAVAGLDNSSVRPSDHLSGETRADFFAACMLMVLDFGLGA